MKKSEFLSLNLLSNNEFPDNWDEKINDNFTKIDSSTEEISNEINNARFNKASLRDFLEESFEDNGSLKPIPEIMRARNSKIYGYQHNKTGIPFELKDVNEFSDMEIFNARLNQTNLRNSLALISTGFIKPNCVFSGMKDSLGNAHFLSSEGNKFRITAEESNPLIINIGGNLSRIDKPITLNKSAKKGLNYVVATFNSETTILDLSQSENETTILQDNNTKESQILSCPSLDFTKTDVSKGNILKILTGNCAGDYIIDEVAPNKIKTQLKIIGRFPKTELIQKLKFIVIDLFKPNFDITDKVLSNMCVLGSGLSDGTALSNVISYSFNNKYESEWRHVDITNGILNETTGTFNHNLGKIPKSVAVLVSDSNDENSFVQISTINGADTECSFQARFDRTKLQLKAKSKVLLNDFNMNNNQLNKISKGYIKVICEA